MHPRHAAIFGIENLELNQHFRSDTSAHIVADTHQVQVAQNSSDNDLHSRTLDVSASLLADINRVIAPDTISNIIQSDSITWHDGILSLPTAQLKPEHKRALWALMSKTLDNL